MPCRIPRLPVREKTRPAHPSSHVSAKNSPSGPSNADFGPFFVRWANFFAHEARQHGEIETNNTTAHPQQGTAETGITSAPENCTKNTHFSPAKAMAVSTGPPHRPAKATLVSVKARPAPAKAMAVSTPYRYQQAKATPVSGERATWSTGPRCDTRGRRRGLAGRPVGGRRYKRRQTNTI